MNLYHSASAVGEYSHSEGYKNLSLGLYSHSEGECTEALDNASHSEGYMTKSVAPASHSEGAFSISAAINSHSEGVFTLASGVASHAEGHTTVSSGTNSHTEGCKTCTGKRINFLNYNSENKTFTFAPETSGYFEFVNHGTYLKGYSSELKTNYFLVKVRHRNINNGEIVIQEETVGMDLTQGYLIGNSGMFAHAEGFETTASGIASHSEGDRTTAEGNFSHASGRCCKAVHDNSYIWKGSNDDTILETTRSEQFMVSAMGGINLFGKVGINTDNLDESLTVNGDVKITGNYHFSRFCEEPKIKTTPIKWIEIVVDGKKYKTPLYL